MKTPNLPIEIPSVVPVKQDFTSVCNQLGVPLADFRAAFCVRCLQIECTQSVHSKSKFEHRVQSWQERLFKEPPRMAPTDPRFKVLSNQKFIDIDAGPVPEVGRSAWIDPMALDEQPKNPQASVEAARAPPVEPELRAVPQQTPVSPLILNTPAQPGRMLGGFKAPIVSADPWAPKPSPQPTQVPIVQPGARIKIG